MEKKGLFKGKIIFVLVALIFALIGTSLFVGNRQIKIANEITVAEDLTGPTESTEGYWTDEGRRGDSFAGGDGLTEETAYEIATAEQLAYLAYSVNNGNSYSGKYFKQTADIDLSKYYWEPIGKEILEGISVLNRNAFAGCYDGLNYTISNLFTVPFPEYFNFDEKNISPNKVQEYLYKFDDQGLFGLLRGGSKVKNVNLSSSIIYGRSGVGGVVGDAGSGSSTTSFINNCHFSGQVIGYYAVGGICGNSNDDYFFNCSNSGYIYARNYQVNYTTYYTNEDGLEIPYITTSKYEGSGYNGGIVGIGGYIKNCYNSGKLSGRRIVGGLAGKAYNIENCYNIGDVKGIEDVGGILGNGGTINNCFNYGSIDGSINVGGIVGKTDESLYDCFNLGNFLRPEYSGGLIGLIDVNISSEIKILNCYYNKIDQIKSVNDINEENSPIIIDNSVCSETLFKDACNINWFLNDKNWFRINSWNFDYIWQMNEDVTEDIPIKFQGESNIIYWTDEEIIGNHQGFEEEGTAEDPYLIEDEYDLAYLSYTVLNSEEPYNYVNKYFKQTRDLDMSQYAWTPIGQAKDVLYGSIQAFSGIYDGCFYTISGLNTYVDIIDYGEYYEGTIFLSNRHTINCQGLFGYAGAEEYSEFTPEIKNVGIKNSHIEGNRYVGAILGGSYNAVKISNCYNESDVLGSSNVGGIVGSTGDGGGLRVIDNCYNSGEIFNTATDFGSVGGICGHGIVVNSYNEGDIYAKNGNVGGISCSGNVINCFNVGELSGERVGGIIYVAKGVNSSNAICYGNYSLGKINATKDSDALVFEGGINNGTNFYANSVGEGVDSKVGELREDISYETFKSLEFFENKENWYFDYQYAVELKNNLYWDFDFTWGFKENENNGFPLLIGQKAYWIDFRADSFSGGDGLTEETAYEISSAEELALLAYEVNYGSTEGLTPGSMSNYSFFEGVYFKQTCDIDLSKYIWSPIGQMNSSTGKINSFAGNYNGNNYKITGIKNETFDAAGGIFGIVINDKGRSLIKNINLIDSNIQATMFCGGIIGMASNVDVINCNNYANVIGYAQYAAGIVSYGMNTNIKNCLNFGEISHALKDNGYTAGIAGGCQGVIENCGNEGALLGGLQAGICLEAIGCNIINCYSISREQSKIVYGISDGTISNCLYINSNGKYYIGATDEEGNDITSFAEFAWINENSCPIPKSLTWLGQYFTQDITEIITDPDSGWISAEA